MSLLELCISVDYAKCPGVLRNLEFSMDSGETVGIIGESGSGKSTLALALMRLLDRKRATVRGRMEFEERDLLLLREREMREIRGHRMSLILQNATAALNPVLRIGTHFRESWLAHQPKDRLGWKVPTMELLERVRLPTTGEFLNRYPREISTGQAQRVLIAMALLHRPSLVIADEPTSALDSITQSEILKLFRELNRDFGAAMLVISHDLLAVADICSRVAILEQGQIVESGPAQRIFEDPQHPYTQRLIGALPVLAWRQ